LKVVFFCSIKIPLGSEQVFSTTNNDLVLLYSFIMLEDRSQGRFYEMKSTDLAGNQSFNGIICSNHLNAVLTHDVLYYG